MDDVVTIMALFAPLIQAMLMGIIGYPIARSRPDGMENFHRSGFGWWIITLCLILIISITWVPVFLYTTTPSTHQPNLLRMSLTIVIGLILLLVLEFIADWIDYNFPSKDAEEGRSRYDTALPKLVRSSMSEFSLVGFTGFLEEGVYRGIALSGLVIGFGFSKALGAGLVSFAFGVSHWYYGYRQILLKMIAGAILCSVAFSSGWLIAAVVHVAFNGILVCFKYKNTILNGILNKEDT